MLVAAPSYPASWYPGSKPGTIEDLAALLAAAARNPELCVGHFIKLAQAFRYAVEADASAAPLEFPIGPALSGISVHHARVKRAIERLRDDLGKHCQVSAAQLASWLGLHPSHFGRLFKSATGIRFREWRRAQLVKEAVSLLAGSDEQVAQVAYGLGYVHATQLSRDFRSVIGLSPRAFQRLTVSSDPGLRAFCGPV
jgi:transcriptional regulator GlxA family with amidase domain